MNAEADEVLVKLTLMLRDVHSVISDHLLTFTEDEILFALEYFEGYMNYRVDTDMWAALANQNKTQATYH